MSERIRGRLICEDRRQESFFRKLLEPLFGTRLNVVISPSGEGAASAWVLKQYPHHVRAWVRRRPGERVALVAAIDGDAVGTAGRMAQADQSLLAAGEPVRGPLEPIAVCAPTWSVETWLLCHQHAFAFFQGCPERIVLDEKMTQHVRDHWDEYFAEPATLPQRVMEMAGT